MYIMKAMSRTQIYLDPTQQRLLKSVAAERGVTLSQLIREAIWGLISNYKKPKADPLQEIVGLYRNEEDRAGALHHDDLYE